MVNRIKVVVCGKEYSLQTEEQPSYIYGLAKRLERQINDLCSSNDCISSYSAAVMIALSTLDDLQKANESIDNIRTQIKEYVDDAGKARMERDEALREVEMLKVKITRLENELKLKKLKENMP